MHIMSSTKSAVLCSLNRDPQLYHQKFRVALPSLAVGILMIVGFSVVEAFTDLNGWTGIDVGIFCTLASAGYAAWAYKKSRTGAPH